ncbi:MAG TPA: universal stress protein [Mycobacterium sp.]|nr:universal stress protein [Mycobacterium sp.]HUH69432.1 universal stress protein [Mycobacterium sp.]
MSSVDYASKWVIVGIDGGGAAIEAAKWAAEEAVSRDVPLRLVYVNPVARKAEPDSGVLQRLEFAESALQRAQAEVQALGKAVDVDTAILRGRPDEVLIEESLDAALIVVGSMGTGRTPTTQIGPVAAAVARAAHCSVAIVRPRTGVETMDTGWIAAVLNDEPDNDAVIHRAMQEARLREAPVLLVDRREDSWIRRYPDVHVQVAAARPGATRTFENLCERLDLVVTGGAEADRLTRLVTPNCHPLLGNANCSVLVVRD